MNQPPHEGTGGQHHRFAQKTQAATGIYAAQLPLLQK